MAQNKSINQAIDILDLRQTVANYSLREPLV